MMHAAYHAEGISRIRQLPEVPTSFDSVSRPLSINPDFIVAREGYHVRLAHGIERLRSRIGDLLERMYSWRGLYLDNSIINDDRPGQTTLVACSGDHPFGTLTVGIDSGEGLLADTLYREEIDAVRRNGAKVCEVTRLAMDPTLSSPEVMATIFHLAFIIARVLHGMTDNFIEVHPRHAGFYRRMLGYEAAGPERICPRVGAPAVLMRLSLAHAAEQIQHFSGTTPSSDRSLYRLFFSPSEQEDLVRRLQSCETACAA